MTLAECIGYIVKHKRQYIGDIVVILLAALGWLIYLQNTVTFGEHFLPYSIRNGVPSSKYQHLMLSNGVHAPSMHPSKLPDNVNKHRPRILVTGAASFMGFHFVEAFYSHAKSMAQHAPSLVLLDDFDNRSGDTPRKRLRQNELKQELNVSIKESSLCEGMNLSKQLEQENVSFVFHMYDPVHFPLDKSSSAQSSRSLQCFRNVVNAVKRWQESTRRVIPVFYLLSSIADSGEHAAGSYTREKPIESFVTTKRMQEALARNYSEHHNIVTIGLRMFNVFGDMCTKDEPMELVSGSKRKPSIVNFYSLDFLHAADAANQILHYPNYILFSGLPEFPIILNVGSGTATPLQNVLHMVSRAATDTKNLSEIEFLTVARVYNSAQKARFPTAFNKTRETVGLSIQERVPSFIAWEEELHFPKGIIMTTYLVGLPDPQRKCKSYSSEGEIHLIRKYYISTVSMHLQVYVIHDGLSDSFEQWFETPKFRFVHVDTLYGRASNSEWKSSLNTDQTIIAGTFSSRK